jgi:hypothetical protein
MTISIQPLDTYGNPRGEPTLTTWDKMLEANDGFDPATLSDMRAALDMGSGYRLGGGAAGAFRISRVG